MLRRLKSASLFSASARRCSCCRICFCRKSWADWNPVLRFFNVFSMKLSSTIRTTCTARSRSVSRYAISKFRSARSLGTSMTAAGQLDAVPEFFEHDFQLGGRGGLLAQVRLGGDVQQRLAPEDDLPDQVDLLVDVQAHREILHERLRGPRSCPGRTWRALRTRPASGRRRASQGGTRPRRQPAHASDIARRCAARQVRPWGFAAWCRLDCNQKFGRRP